jgi:hypothetical protein
MRPSSTTISLDSKFPSPNWSGSFPWIRVDQVLQIFIESMNVSYSQIPDRGPALRPSVQLQKVLDCISVEPEVPLLLSAKNIMRDLAPSQNAALSEGFELRSVSAY